MPMKLSLKQWLVWQLRKASYRWPYRYEAMKLAKTGKNTYKCAICGGNYERKGGTGTRKSISLDHIKPCVDPSKPNAFEADLETCICGVCEYIRRMFPPATGFQVLCKLCHDTKTGSERAIRQALKPKKVKKARK